MQPVAHHGRAVLGQHQLHTRGGTQVLCGDEIADRGEGPEDVLCTGLGDIEDGGALAVEQHLLLVAVEAVGNGGDLTEADGSAAGAGDHHQVLELGGGLALVIEAQQYVFLVALQLTGRAAYALPLHSGSNVGGRQSVAAQRGRIDLDADLVGGEALDGHGGNLAERLQAGLDVFGVGLECDRILWSGDRDRDHGIGAAEFLHYRRLCLVGKVADGVDLGLHVVEKPRHVGALAHYRGGDADTFAGLAARLVDVGDAVDRVFDAATDRVLDLGRGGALVHHADLDLVVLDLGEGLTLQTGQRDDAQDHDRRHEQVGRGGVTGEPGDHCAPLAAVSICACMASSGTASSNIPGTAGTRSLTTSRSPACTPAAMTLSGPWLNSTSTGRACRRWSSPTT